MPYPRLDVPSGHTLQHLQQPMFILICHGLSQYIYIYIYIYIYMYVYIYMYNLYIIVLSYDDLS